MFFSKVLCALDHLVAPIAPIDAPFTITHCGQLFGQPHCDTMCFALNLKTAFRMDPMAINIRCIKFKYCDLITPLRLATAVVQTQTMCEASHEQYKAGRNAQL